jgi:hypothetical protein
MDAAIARRLIETHTQWDTGPGPLTVAEVDDLLMLAERVDVDGLEPDDAGWTPTYDVREAAAVGWEWRAGKLTDRFKVALGAGTSFERQWTPEFCLTMADRMRGGGSGGGAVSVPLSSAWVS